MVPSQPLASESTPRATGGRPAPASSTFGSLTFSLETMRRRLPRPVYDAIQATIRRGEPLDVGLADFVAGAMKDWALEHGATHFTHWFHPLTGATAEKHDAFLSISGGQPIEAFSGGQLIQAEPDASSFPSGGMRSTFEARGYSAWDPTSPAFLVYNENGATLTIPSVFVSFTGEALDTKTPLLRSQRELSRAAVRVLKLMGRDAQRVTSTLGIEQEYFLVKREYYEGRPDLQVTGRTLLGAQPPKGQQLEDHYFGAIDDRALDFMAEVETEAWKLGLPLKTRHNEVAPHQYEAAPIFTAGNLAADQNQVLMQILRKVARARGLSVLLHEKPFAGVNGSGKHNNWSMADDQGNNLLEPGDNPHRNVEFLFFVAAVVSAVHKRARLLRCAVAHAGNDHRLGANEAPPAIISVFLGDHLTPIFEALRAGRSGSDAVQQVIRTGLEALPAVKKDNTDRNRTSPFAFTGNKFEFRAVGSSQASGVPLCYLNVAVAEALDGLGDLLEKRLAAGEERTAAMLAVIRESYEKTHAIVFNGNNYSQAWHEEAARRGLPNERDTPAALRVLDEPDTAAFLDRYGIIKPHETKARYAVLVEQYVRQVEIEAVQMLRMAKTGVLPAVLRQQREMAEAIAGAAAAGADVAAQKGLLAAYAKAVNDCIAAVDGVRQVLAHGHGHDAMAHARASADRLLPAMRTLREACDLLERRTDERAWPFPSYHQLLFQ
ncbi:MAG: glutamine synthetase III [Planctomycetia bacterium]